VNIAEWGTKIVNNKSQNNYPTLSEVNLQIS